MIDHWPCTLVDRHLNCDRPACPNHVPAVPGDFNRRRPVCFGVLVEVSQVTAERARKKRDEYAMGRDRVAWLLGIHEQSVRRDEERALARMRKELAA